MDESKRNSVLVVDDEPNAFDVIEAHLYREGYELFYAASGMEVLNSLDTIEPDVILLDVMMPEMDGIEVCRKIKSDATWKHIPIIIVTALNSKEDLARAIDAGADDFLTKPVSGVELRARVRSMLRIKQQYDALEATLHLREDLSNMIVHDLRNPLTTIMLSSSLMLQMGVEGKSRERVQLVADAARDLNSMINDLLMLTKMESGKMLLKRVDVDLNQLALRVVSQFQAIAGEKKIHLMPQLPVEGQAILIDQNLFHRVLDNLISNAIKFSPPESTVILHVQYPDSLLGEREKLKEEKTSDISSPFPQNSLPDSPSQATIRVIDCGPGIREDKRQRIFDKYEVGSVMTGVSQLGLGLAFCKMVVEAHQGKIVVEDNLPHGSIFTVIL